MFFSCCFFTAESVKECAIPSVPPPVHKPRVGKCPKQYVLNRMFEMNCYPDTTGDDESSADFKTFIIFILDANHMFPNAGLSNESFGKMKPARWRNFLEDVCNKK